MGWHNDLIDGGPPLFSCSLREELGRRGLGDSCEGATLSNLSWSYLEVIDDCYVVSVTVTVAIPFGLAGIK